MLGKPLESWKKGKELAGKFYEKLATAHTKGNIMAWGGASAPCEILRAMQIEPILGEPYGALCTAGNFSEDLFEATESYEGHGFGKELCAYSRNFMGSYLKNRGPFGEMPAPDFLIAARLGCNDHLTWYEIISKMTGKPLIVVDIPFVYEEAKEHHIEYVQLQLENFVDYLENLRGQKLDEEAFLSLLICGKKTKDLWSQILEVCKKVPAPLNFKTQLSMMVPAVSLKGMPEAADFYAELLDEIKERVSEGARAIPEEKFRLLWDSIPMWYYLQIFTYLERKGALVVVSPYVHGFGTDRLDFSLLSEEDKARLRWLEPTTISEGLREIAKDYLRSQVDQNLVAKQGYYEQVVKDYAVNACIFHNNRGCKSVSLNKLDVANYLEEKLGLPILFIEGSNADPRDFDEKQALSKIDNFLATL